MPAIQLRNGVSPNAVSPQPWFENLLPGRGTHYAASARSNDFIQGNLSDFGLSFLDNALPSFASNGGVRDFLFRTAGGRSNYHSANITLHKDFSSGLQLIAGYSFSKSLNDFDESQGWPIIVMDSYNLGANYGPSSVDERHMLSALWLYELPFGRSRKLLNRGGILNAIFGGWFISGIGRAASVMPLTVVSSWEGFGGGSVFAEGAGAIGVSKPHYDSSVHQTPGSEGIGTNADPSFGGSGLNRFADPAAVYNSFRRISVSLDGRSGRGTLRDLPTWNVDLSAGKLFSVSERARVGFSLEFLNAFNHVIYQYNTLNLNNPQNFGVIIWQANSPRVIQPGLRIEW